MTKLNLRSSGLLVVAGVAASSLTACGAGGAPVASTPPPIGAGPVGSPSPAPTPSPSPTPSPTPTPTPTSTPPSAFCGSSCNPVAPPPGYVITPSNLQPKRAVADDDEYRRNYTVAEYINALFALENNWVGQGVLVGVMDNGVHAIGDLEGKVSTQLSRDFGYIETNGVRTSRTGLASIGDASSNHGTPVAAIIAARDDGQNVQGLAPGATIVSLRVDSIVDGQSVWGTGRDLALRHAADNGIPLVNMSLALRPGTRASQQFMNALAYYNQRERGLLIAAAGNNSLDTSPTFVEVDPAFVQSWLFVAALASDGRGYDLADYSNRCGSLMNRCVVAPTLSVTMGSSGQSQTFGGTSSATPVVSAVAAMILSKWPQLTGVDAGNIILRSARDLGAPGVDPIYGHGLVDAEAALKPVNPMLSNGVTSAPINGTIMVLGKAFGEGGSATFEQALGAVTVVDAYGRDYSGSVTGLIVQPTTDQLAMTRRVAAQMHAHTAGFTNRAGSAVLGVTAFDTGFRDQSGNPTLDYQLTNADVMVRLTDDWLLTGGYNSQDNAMNDIIGLAPTSDAMLAYSPMAQTSLGIAYALGRGQIALSANKGSYGDVAVKGATLQFSHAATSFKLGVVNESGSVFGTPVGFGIMRFGNGARTYFFEAASGFDLGKWRLDGFASIGGTRLKLSGDTLLTDAELIRSGRFGIIASRPVLGGRLSLGVAQPLVVLGGEATFTVGDAYSRDARSLLFQNRQANLSGGIVPQFTIGYERFGMRSALRLGASSDASGKDIRAVASWNLRLGR